MHAIRVTGVAGAERQLIDLLCAPGWDGFELELRFFVGDGVDAADLAEPTGAGHRVTISPMPHDFSLACLRSLRDGFRRFDVVHTHLVHADWHGLLASQGRRAGWITSKHNQDRFRTHGAFLAVERLVDRRADRVVAISQALRRFVEDTTGARAEVVPYGLRGAPVPPEDVRAEGPFALLLAGRLVQQKGVDTAIRALPPVVEAFPGTTLTVAGDGPDRRRLEALAGQLGVTEAVDFRGWVDDVPGLMAQHDLLVHPARWEGFGLVLLEAMAARLPVVATSAGAIPEVLDGAGRLVPPD